MIPRQAMDREERELDAAEGWTRSEQERAKRIEAIERSQTHSINREAKIERKRKAARKAAKRARRANR